ncbi:interleukin-18-like isoform 1-T2 [Anomaloglossus baeobatrachus]|uniref:interleukin-18-like n=1 Tax=Anomaloglossus baeobatrachus TaxID=238106 RepID=UPI003F4F9735
MDGRQNQRNHHYVLREKRHSFDEIDAFKMSLNMQRVFPQVIKNGLNELLIAHPEKAHAIFEPDEDTTAEQAAFYLHKYREDAHHRFGLPVTISCKIGNRNYVLKVGNSESDAVYVEEQVLPKEIPSTTSELIFYLQEFSIGHPYFCFESSLKEGFCLAWNAEKKLILKPKGSLDETISFLLVRQN